MKIKFLFLLGISIFLANCSSTRKVAKPNIENTTISTDRDGSSYEKAIIITEKSSREGISAEYAYVRGKYPGYKMRLQQLSHYKSKPYDILNITTAEGKDISVYFDISNFFGKF